MKIADTSGQDVRVEKPPATKKKVLIISLAIAALAIVFWMFAPAASKWSQAERSIARDRVRIDTVKIDDLIRDISVQGKVVAAVSPKLYAPADGFISFDVEAGTQVVKGQQLASLESPELTNLLKQEKSKYDGLVSALERKKIQSKIALLEDQKAIDLAQVRLTTAEREKRRSDIAYEKKVINQIDFEKAQDDLQNAELVYKHAVQDAQLNKENLEFEVATSEQELNRQALQVNELQRQVDSLAISSPVNGIVGNLAIDNKTRMAKNQLILTVVDLSQFEVEIAIPESYADDLAIGMAVEVNFDQTLYTADLVTISPEIINNQVTARVRFNNGSPRSLRQNQRLTTRILLEQRNEVLLVKRGQFLDSSNGRFAYKVTNGMAVKTPINIGARSLNAVEILGGLKQGDQIITSGTDIFRGAEQVLLTQ